ncbi:MAG: hypothetical protein K0S48_1061 [Ramlibacter sp.]|nr:hypothetical protein [Ramlibacter sp.]
MWGHMWAWDGSWAGGWGWFGLLHLAWWLLLIAGAVLLVRALAGGGWGAAEGLTRAGRTAGSPALRP